MSGWAAASSAGLVRCVLAGTLLCASARPWGAPPDAARPDEYEIKAAFLFNFVKFAAWPDSAFPALDSKVVVCSAGDDRSWESLEATLGGKTVHGRGVEIRRWGAADNSGCHVVFIAASDAHRLDRILAAVDGRPVMTVGDLPGMAQRGAMISFHLNGNRVGFQINPDVVARGGLKLSSHLLKLAVLVKTAEDK